MATRLKVVAVGEVGSTQSEARRLAEELDSATLLLVAARQTAGRGRRGRRWIAAPRALACSLVTAPGWHSSAWGTIPLVAGLAARRALHAHTAVEPGLKWPNDVVTPAGKVGGMLAEATRESIVIGFGANLWWPDAPAGIAAVCADDPGADLAHSIARTWADRLLHVLAGPAAEWGLAEYRAACLTPGTAITWEPGGAGEAVDVAADGGLVVATGRGRATLYSGEVHSVRPTTLAPEPGGDHKGPRG